MESILSNSERSEEEEDELPPAAELGLDEEVDDGDDEDLLLCDTDGEELEPLVLFDESAA